MTSTYISAINHWCRSLDRRGSVTLISMFIVVHLNHGCLHAAHMWMWGVGTSEGKSKNGLTVTDT